VGYNSLRGPTGLPGLIDTYHLPLDGSPRSMDLGLLYQALKQKQVTWWPATLTDGLIAAMRLTMLSDDKNYFPPYEARSQCAASRSSARRSMSCPEKFPPWPCVI